MPSDLTVGQFVYVIRKRIKLSPEKAIFIFVDEVLPPTAALMSSIYEEHKDEDGYDWSSNKEASSVLLLAILFRRLCANARILDFFTLHTPARTRLVFSKRANSRPDLCRDD